MVKEYVRKSTELDFENFKDYMDTLESIRWVKLNPETCQLSTCTCTTWVKNYICKHVISLSKTAGLFQTFPAVDKLIESNNKRGRKKKLYMLFLSKST